MKNAALLGQEIPLLDNTGLTMEYNDQFPKIPDCKTI